MCLVFLVLSLYKPRSYIKITSRKKNEKFYCIHKFYSVMLLYHLLCDLILLQSTFTILSLILENSDKIRSWLTHQGMYACHIISSLNIKIQTTVNLEIEITNRNIHHRDFIPCYNIDSDIAVASGKRTFVKIVHDPRKFSDLEYS